MSDRKKAIETLKENLCAMCAYGSQNMESCDIRSCDNRDAIKALEQEPKPMVEIDLYSVIKQKYIEREVLDKIRADIQFIKDKCLPNNIAEEYEQKGLQEALDIIDMYKAETER